MATADHFLDRYLDPVAEVLTPQVAQRILDLEPEPDVVRRVEQLGEKSDAGTLTDEERDEYRASRCGHIGCFAKSQGAAVPRSARYLIHGRTDAKTRASAGRRVL